MPPGTAIVNYRNAYMTNVREASASSRNSKKSARQIMAPKEQQDLQDKIQKMKLKVPVPKFKGVKAPPKKSVEGALNKKNSVKSLSFNKPKDMFEDSP